MMDGEYILYYGSLDKFRDDFHFWIFGHFVHPNLKNVTFTSTKKNICDTVSLLKKRKKIDNRINIAIYKRMRKAIDGSLLAEDFIDGLTSENRLIFFDIILNYIVLRKVLFNKRLPLILCPISNFEKTLDHHSIEDIKKELLYHIDNDDFEVETMKLRKEVDYLLFKGYFQTEGKDKKTLNSMLLPVSCKNILPKYDNFIVFMSQNIVNNSLDIYKKYSPEKTKKIYKELFTLLTSYSEKEILQHYKKKSKHFLIWDNCAVMFININIFLFNKKIEVYGSDVKLVAN